MRESSCFFDWAVGVWLGIYLNYNCKRILQQKYIFVHSKSMVNWGLVARKANLPKMPFF